MTQQCGCGAVRGLRRRLPRRHLTQEGIAYRCVGALWFAGLTLREWHPHARCRAVQRAPLTLGNFSHPTMEVSVSIRPVPSHNLELTHLVSSAHLALDRIQQHLNSPFSSISYESRLW